MSAMGILVYSQVILHLLFSDDTCILKIGREDLADQTVTMAINK
jgi:hypothetical protein